MVKENATVDGRDPANQLRLVAYPTIYRVLYIPGGAGFRPSTVPDLPNTLLIGGFNPFEKYVCQIGSSPQIKRTYLNPK